MTSSEPLHGASDETLSGSPSDLEISRIYPDANLRRAFEPDPPGQWYVLRTKPRQESRAQLNLQAWGLETLLPLNRSGNRVIGKSGDRTPVCMLFPSYIFCKFAETMFGKVKYTYGVAHIVSFGGVPAVVDQAIIDELAARALPLHGASGHGSAVSFRRGDKVLIESGPFKNFIGIFEQDLPGSERVRILLDAVKFQSRVECGRGEIKPLTTENQSSPRRHGGTEENR
jgi:transcriptional antiterminator RfaH